MSILHPEQTPELAAREAQFDRDVAAAGALSVAAAVDTGAFLTPGIMIDGAFGHEWGEVTATATVPDQIRKYEPLFGKNYHHVYLGISTPNATTYLGVSSAASQEMSNSYRTIATPRPIIAVPTATRPDLKFLLRPGERAQYGDSRSNRFGNGHLYPQYAREVSVYAPSISAAHLVYDALGRAMGLPPDMQLPWVRMAGENLEALLALAETVKTGKSERPRRRT